MATERRVSNLNQSIKNFKWAASHSFRCDEFLVCLEKKQIQQQQQKKDQYNLYAVFILCLFVCFICNHSFFVQFALKVAFMQTNANLILISVYFFFYLLQVVCIDFVSKLHEIPIL